MSRTKATPPENIVGRRIRALREQLGWSQEKLGVAIGIDESSARARISRYELGVHEPPLPTTKLLATALGVPLSYIFCDDDSVADLIKRLYYLDQETRNQKVQEFALSLPA